MLKRKALLSTMLEQPPEILGLLKKEEKNQTFRMRKCVAFSIFKLTKFVYRKGFPKSCYTLSRMTLRK